MGPALAPSIDGAPDLAAARSALLRTEFSTSHGWVSQDVEPELLSPRPSRAWRPPAPFSAHETFSLPDRPPVDGARSSSVHRFVLDADTAAALNLQLTGEAQQRTWGPKRFFGEHKSNVGGFHSNEEAFVSAVDAERCSWYSSLLHDILQPALRSLDGEGAGGRANVDANGVPLEGRITGWLNVSEPHAYNALHRHGTDVAWSLVYFVASGDDAEQAPQVGASAREVEPPHMRGRDEPADPLRNWLLWARSLVQANDQTNAAPSTAATAVDASASAAAAPVKAVAGGAALSAESGGALLLRTQPDPQTGASGYFPIQPSAGELWCFPGYMAHAVMPRRLRRARDGSNSTPAVDGGGEGGEGGDVPLTDLAAAVMGQRRQRRGERISVACNVYLLSSAYRDKRIGYRDHAPPIGDGRHRMRECCVAAPWGDLGIPPDGSSSRVESDLELLARRRQILTRARRTVDEDEVP